MIKNSESRKISLKSKNLVQYGGYLAIIVIAIFFSIKSPIFIQPSNIVNILLQTGALGIVGLGMTIILIGGGSDVIKGGIDLSLANNIALSTAIFAVSINNGMPIFVAFLVTLGFALLIGCINAFSVVVLKIAPLLATVSTMYILQGAELLITNNKVVNAVNPFLTSIAERKFLEIPIIAWVFIIVAIIAYILMNKTKYGNWVSAVGGNVQAATNAGINVKWVIASTYLLAAFTAAIASTLVVSRLSGSVRGIGDVMLFDVLLIGYLSAIFSKSFVPNIPGAIISAFFVGMLSNGFTLINVPTYWVFAIKGALILLSVSITSVQQRRIK